jgi:hypothetical protein
MARKVEKVVSRMFGATLEARIVFDLLDLVKIGSKNPSDHRP